MRHLFLCAMLGSISLTACSSWAQMHKVAKPEQVVRAVGVYEWTGDLNKPTASRLIPVSIFVEGKLEDAGVYVARPVPFALLPGNIYELQDAGVDKGMLDLVYARHLQATDATGDLAYDDGWFGYGSVKPLAAAKKPAKLRPSKTLPTLTSSSTASTGGDQTKSANDSTGDPDRPTMKRRSSESTTDNSTPAGTSGTTASTTAPAQGSSSTPADDPDRPTMKRRSDSTTDSTPTDTTSTTTSTATASTPPADDPDRPTMKRRTTDSTTTANSTSSTGAGSPPADDPDRPTLKRHSAADAKKANGSDVAAVSSSGSLNDDPDRPNLHHGKPVGAMTEAELPKLVGLPPDLHQMVAVSDAANRDPHEFALAFSDTAERASVLAKLQVMARAQLAAYMEAASGASKAVPVAKRPVAGTARRKTAPTKADQDDLLEEQLKAYTLSYGGAATYVYTTHTGGTGSALRYVTIVAQADGLGELKAAIQSVTDAAHLDRTPRMRFVDVVDAEASNRASLLFELRGQSSRQFGLYRVIAAHSEQIFLTGTTQ